MAIYYSIQTKEAYNDALLKGYLEGNRKYIDDFFINSYHWIMKQMNKRLVNYNTEYPIWLWSKKTIIENGVYEKDTEWVLLKIFIDDKDVLLSDFMSWHCVLNNIMLPINKNEEDIKDKNIIQKSWERIFDINMLKNNEYILENISDVDEIQGVTGRIKINDIKMIKNFVVR